METYRLKNIILVILLLLNVFLLLLVASRGYAQHRSAQNLIDQTVLFRKTATYPLILNCCRDRILLSRIPMSAIWKKNRLSLPHCSARW